jgi:hypothetical protein
MLNPNLITFLSAGLLTITCLPARLLACVLLACAAPIITTTKVMPDGCITMVQKVPSAVSTRSLRPS